MGSVARTSYAGRQIEGRYMVSGGSLLLHSEFGVGRCPLGGVPPQLLAVMLLRDQARLAHAAEAEG